MHMNIKSYTKAYCSVANLTLSIGKRTPAGNQRHLFSVLPSVHKHRACLLQAPHIVYCDHQ